MPVVQGTRIGSWTQTPDEQAYFRRLEQINRPERTRSVPKQPEYRGTQVIESGSGGWWQQSESVRLHFLRNAAWKIWKDFARAENQRLITRGRRIVEDDL
jgi:hypothetical protein